MNRLYPAETRLKEGAIALDSDAEQVGVFPCRGWVAPCQRAPRSMRICRLDVNAAAHSVSLDMEPYATRITRARRRNPSGSETRASVVANGRARLIPSAVGS